MKQPGARHRRFVLVTAAFVTGAVVVALQRIVSDENAVAAAPREISFVPVATPLPSTASHSPPATSLDGWRSYTARLRSAGWDERAVQRHVTEALCARFHREQYAAELAFGQLFYPAHYWEPAPELEALVAADHARLGELRRLDGELDELLTGLFGAASERVPPRRSLFSAEVPPPKLDFLPPESRARFEEALLASDPEARFSSVERLTLAECLLPPDEFALFVRWNSPTAAALRGQLAGFSPSESEYNAIFDWKEIAASEAGFSNADAQTQARTKLGAALGDARAAEFLGTEDPAYQTAVADLRQLGLPLARASEVAALRREASEAISAIWRDPLISREGKPAQAEEARQVYRRRLAALFGVSPDLLPPETM